MRKSLLLALPALALSLLVAGLAQGKPALTGGCAKSSLTLVKSGQLTVGTDNPAYPPWFGGNQGQGWKVSDPYSGKGYESAVAYAVATQLGFSKGEVKWTYVPFDKSFAPGKKGFDFDINEVSFTPERAKVVDFSDSYYDVNQALVVRDGTPIAKARSIAALKPFTLGAETGTTSYQFIASAIKPKSVKVYNSNALAVAAVKSGRIDGLVVDLPTAFYVTAVQVPHSKILGQFAGKTGEHFGLVFQKGNPLAGCVDTALAKLKKNGTLTKINETWLSKVVAVPLLK